jgi:hypothetical protein
VRGKLIGHFIVNDKEIVAQVITILKGISQDELKRIFKTKSKGFGISSILKGSTYASKALY